MSDSSPPPARRPWYLIAALIGALLLGAGGWLDGCSTITFYREPVDTSFEKMEDKVAREQAKKAAEKYVAAVDAARPHAFPLGAATFVLGAAVVALVVRAFAGQSGARGALVQVLSVQALLAVIAYLLTRDIRDAQLTFFTEMSRLTPPPRGDALHANHALDAITVPAIWRVVMPAFLVLRSGFAALLVFALTRPRAVASFEAPAVSER
jgi:hypothetical protein